MTLETLENTHMPQAVAYRWRIHTGGTGTPHDEREWSRQSDVKNESHLLDVLGLVSSYQAYYNSAKSTWLLRLRLGILFFMGLMCDGSRRTDGRVHDEREWSPRSDGNITFHDTTLLDATGTVRTCSRLIWEYAI